MLIQVALGRTGGERGGNYILVGGMQAACAFSILTARVRHASARIRFMMLQPDRPQLFLRNMELKKKKRGQVRETFCKHLVMW